MTYSGEPFALPARPRLEQYRKRAKELVLAVRSGNSDAVAAWAARWRPDDAAARVAVEAFARAALRRVEPHTAEPQLATAQFVVARIHGYPHWAAFAAAVHARERASDADSIPWARAEAAIVAGDDAALAVLLAECPALRTAQPPPYTPDGPAPDYRSGDARGIVAREQFFEDWPAYAAFARERDRSDGDVAAFEFAADAVVAGDLRTLQALLRERPALVRARSSRRHRATLLHYVGANGIEGFRQRTPPNAVDVATLLLEAGADVDARASMYGDADTTLGLVATSVHPARAGVADDLIALLVARGAAVADPAFVNAALANGRGDAAASLAAHGAPLDLEGAAGVGRVDLVRTYFDDAGCLRETATQQQLADAFAWACEFGRTDVVAFLLDCGVTAGAPLRHHGQTGLHWAAFGGHAATVDLLLARGAPVGARDATFGAAPLGWALYAWSNAPPRTARDAWIDVARRLVAAGADAAELLADDSRIASLVRDDARMAAALAPA